MKSVIVPQLRKTSEIPYHSDSAPGRRYVFVGKTLDAMCRLYVVGRKVEAIPADQPEWLDDHRHNCPTFYVLIGHNRDLTGLAAEIVIEGRAFLAEAPAVIMLPRAALHHHRLVAGGGWSFHLNVRPDYVESLLEAPGSQTAIAQPPEIEEIYRRGEPHSAIARNWEIRDGALKAYRDERYPILWKFISPDEFRDPGLRLLVHQISQKEHNGWQEAIHKHPTDEVYVVLADEGDSLELGVTVDGQFTQVRAPISIYHEAGVPHAYQLIRGSGLVLKILRL